MFNVYNIYSMYTRDLRDPMLDVVSNECLTLYSTTTTLHILCVDFKMG